MSKSTCLPDRLREALARAGMSQADAARAMGSDNRKLINEIVSGRRPKLAQDLDMLRRLADVLGVSPEWLAGWDE